MLVRTMPVAVELVLLLVTVTMYVSSPSATTVEAAGEMLTARSAASVAPAATTAVENSETSPSGSVAVAVTSEPLGMGAASAKLIFAWPLVSVATFIEPRKVCPWAMLVVLAGLLA